MKVGINAFMLERDMSGIEVYTKKLIDGFINRDVNFELYSYSKLDKFPEYTKFLKTSNLRLNINQIKKLYWSQFSIPKLVSNDVDVYFSPSFILPYGLPKKIKKVITIHDLAFLRFPEYTSFKERIYYKLILEYSIKSADIIIAISDSTVEDIKYFFPKYAPKIVKINNGFEDYSKIESDNIILNKYNLEDKKYFLSVGTIHKRKNIETTLKVFADISTLHPDFKLVIVGKDGDKIKSKYNITNPNVIFTGYITDMQLASLYKHTFLFLFLSHYEGFGFPILEAMSCKTPVLTVNNSSLPEISGYDLDYLPNSYDVNEIVKLLIKIINNEEAYNLLKKHAEKQIKNFSWEKMIDKTISIFKN